MEKEVKNESEFHEMSIGYPFRFGEFSHIDDATQEKLLKLMARISEKSYRRGYQHGGLEKRVVSPEHLRFNVSLDLSPYTDVVDKNGEWACTNHLSMDRLKMEYCVLNDLGFSL